MNKKEKPTIILVKPQMGENIGAAARVMANFGLSDLRLINPRDGWPNPKAIEMSAHANDIVNSAKIFDSLEKASSDLNFLYATSARQRSLDKVVITSKKIILQDKTGFVFGGERSGLDNDDIAFCDKVISIPVAEYKSINLAMSVGIISYEISLLAEKQTTRQRDLATKADMSSLFRHLETELDTRGFFQAAEKKPGMMQNIKTFLTRAALSKQESQTLRGIIRSLAEHQPKK